MNDLNGAAELEKPGGPMRTSVALHAVAGGIDLRPCVAWLEDSDDRAPRAELVQGM